jgi:hypothetical protein
MTLTQTPDGINLLPIYIPNDLKHWFEVAKTSPGCLNNSTGATIERLDGCWIQTKGRKQYSMVDDALLRDLRDTLRDVYRVKEDE